MPGITKEFFLLASHVPRPLPVDNGFDTIITFTDRLGSDIQIIPTTSTLTTKELADTFFNIWYCENGLPLDIISDQDKLFMSHFWKRLHTLTSIKLKMSTAYHPETDGSSEWTSKTVVQCICFTVECNQLGWVKSLPKIRFDIENTIDCSTASTPFQLQFGRSPCILLPLIPSEQLIATDKFITNLLQWMQHFMAEVQDNLISAKVLQAFQANKGQSLPFPFKVSNQVVSSPLHSHWEIKAGVWTMLQSSCHDLMDLLLWKVLTSNTLQWHWI